MTEDKDVQIQVYSECFGYSIQVLNADGDRVLFNKDWSRDEDTLWAGGEANFVDLLKFLGYTVYHEEVYL